MNPPTPPRLDLVLLCVLFALGCLLARAGIDSAAYLSCMNHAGGVACRVAKNDAGGSWGAAAAMALGIAIRERQ